jgi:hypothetical protein
MFCRSTKKLSSEKLWCTLQLGGQNDSCCISFPPLWFLPERNVFLQSEAETDRKSKRLKLSLSGCVCVSTDRAGCGSVYLWEWSCFFVLCTAQCNVESTLTSHAPYPIKGTKTTCPIPLFNSLCKNKDNMSHTSLRFSLEEKDDKSYTSLWFSLEEQRQQILHLSLILFARTKTTSPAPLSESLCKNKDDKSYSCRLSFF